MHSESDRIVWDGSDCPLHYYQGGMMTENYTTEDFAQATLATRGKYNYARRIASGGPEPWRDGGRIWRSDAQLAAEGWTPVVESRITLDGLAGAWETAEVPTADTPIREGDVVIEKISASAYAVMSPPPTCGLVGREFRVLSRAPREPWQDLADSLEAEVQWIDRFNAVDAAQALHAAGWRKGGDES